MCVYVEVVFVGGLSMINVLEGWAGCAIHIHDDKRWDAHKMRTWKALYWAMRIRPMSVPCAPMPESYLQFVCV